MVVACRGDGVEAVDGAEVDLSPEAAGPPEGGKVLGRGSAPMDAVLSIGPYDAEQAAGVTFPQVYRYCAGAGDAKNTGRAFCHLAAVTRGGGASRHGGAGGLEVTLET